jgi:Asp/Glu/hydantoin racemase
MSKILVINPNSTQAVTDHISLCLQPFRFEGGPQLDCQTLRSGPPGIESQAHVDSISDKLLRWLEENPAYREIDAWVLACFSDPGLFAMREVLPCPVIGCAEASYHAASAMADKFGVISILARAVPRHLRQIRLLGLDHKLARDLPIEVNVVNLGDESLTFTRMRDVGQRLVHEHGAGVVIMGCAGMARYRQRLEDFLKVPVIDPTQAGVALAMGRVLAQQALA